MKARRVVIGLGEADGIEVACSEATEYWRDSAAGLEAFETGDVVVIRAQPARDQFRAGLITPIYQSVEVTVIDRAGTVLETSGGALSFSAETRDSESRHRITTKDVPVGARLKALVRHNVDSGAFIAARIALFGHGRGS